MRMKKCIVYRTSGIKYARFIKKISDSITKNKNLQMIEGNLSITRHLDYDTIKS
jgi:hypothetical protein